MTISISDVIAEQYAAAQQYGSEADNYLQLALNNASTYFNSLNFNAATVSWTPTTLVTDAPTTTTQTITAQYYAPTPIGEFNTSQLQTIDQIGTIVLPQTPVVTTTGLFNEAVPVNTVSDFSSTAPVIDFTAITNALSQIAIPTIQTYAPPTLAPINIAPVPTVNIPSFDPSLNVTDPGTFSGMEQAFALQYQTVLPEMKAFIDGGVNLWEQTYAPSYSAGLAALEAKLQDGINRGTALGADFEEALYARARSRAETNNDRTILDIQLAHRKRGFEEPPASLIAGINLAQQQTANAIAVQATELSIERAKMEIQHIQFVLKTSSDLRQILLDSFLRYASVLAQINGNAIEYGKFFAEALLQMYEAAIKHYLAQQEYFKTQAALYETYLKASLATLEVYKLELEATKIAVDVENLQVVNYKTLVESELLTIQMYTELLKNVEVRTEVAKAQIEVFAEQVKAYVAQLEGQKIKNDIYIAQLQGDKYKLDAQMTLLEAYKIDVEAQKELVDASVAIQDLRIEQNKLLVEVYQAEVEGFKAEIDSATAAFQGSVQAQIAQVDAYKTNIEAQVEVYQAKIERDKLTLEDAIEQAKLIQETYMKQIDATVSLYSLNANVAKEVGATYGSMASSALVSQGTQVSQASSA